MKNNTLLAVIAVLLSYQLSAQKYFASVGEVTVQANAYGQRVEAFIGFNLLLPGNIKIDPFSSAENDYQVMLVSDEYSSVLEKYKPRIESDFKAAEVIFRIELNSPQLIELLVEMPESFYLSSESDLEFPGLDNDTIILPAALLASASRGKIAIPDEYRLELISSLAGNLRRYRNNFNIGFDPGIKPFALSFDYLFSKPYGNNKNGLFFFSEGRLSTNKFDSLNFFRVLPINANIWAQKNALYHFAANAGLEANQQFSMARVLAGVKFEGIIPNLIDLTYGYDRLRLKPVITAGINYYNEVRVPEGQNKQNAFLLSGEIYYYVPVMDSYYLLVQGKTFYDTGKEQTDAWNYNISLALGLEFPSAPATILAKYVFGANEVTYERNDQLLIGFAMDLFTSSRKNR